MSCLACTCAAGDLMQYAGCGDCAGGETHTQASGRWSAMESVGILIYIVGVVLYALGPHLKKWAGINKEKRCASVLGVVGMTGYALAGVFWGAATQFAPLAVLGPFLALAVVLSYVFGYLLNGEVAGWYDKIGGCFLIVSVVLLGISMPPAVLTPPFEGMSDDIERCMRISCWVDNTYLGSTPFKITALIVVVAILACLGMIARGRFIGQQYNLANEDLDAYRVSFAVLAGLGGGYGTVVAQPLVNFVVGTLRCPGVLFTSFQIYVLGAAMGVLAFLQVTYVAKGLNVAHAKMVVGLEIITNFLTTTAGGLLGAQGFRAVGDSALLGHSSFLTWLIIGLGFGAAVIGSALIVKGVSATKTLESMQVGPHGSVINFRIGGVSAQWSSPGSHADSQGPSADEIGAANDDIFVIDLEDEDKSEQERGHARVPVQAAAWGHSNSQR